MAGALGLSQRNGGEDGFRNTPRATMDRMNDERLAFPRAELRRRTVRGALVNGAFLSAAELLVLAQGLIVTVLLGPSELGLYGIVTTTAMTVVALRRVGIDEAFVQQSEDDQAEEFQRAFTLELVVGAAFSVLLLAAAPLTAMVYDDDRLLPLMIAVAYLPLAMALQAPTWIFFRRMDFVRVRALQATIPIVTFAVTVPLAFAGVGVWSLVIGPFVGNLVAVVAGVTLSPYRLRLRFDPEARRRYFRFSWPIFASSFAVLLFQQGQILAFKLEGGLAAAGFITLAVTLTRYADRADQIIATTIYPAIVLVKDRLPTLEEIFVKSNRAALMWVLPFCAGCILFAGDLVGFVLGDEWQPAVLLLQGLAGAGAIQQLGYNWFTFYRARGDSARQAVESAFMAATFLALAVPALFVWGVEGFVAARIGAAVLVLLVRRHYVRKLLGVELLTIGARAAVPVAAATGAVLLVRALVWSGERGAGHAIADLAVFGALTVGLTWAAERALVGELAAQARSGGLRGAARAVTG